MQNNLITKPVIIYVDDEQHNLTVFEASIPEEWTIYTFDNAAEALTKIEELNPWVVISDQRMPIMDGLTFLKNTRQLCPNAIRIVVTGQTDEQIIGQLVRKVKIYNFIAKPWDTEELIEDISEALDYYKTIENQKLKITNLEKHNMDLQVNNEQLKQKYIELIETKQTEQNFDMSKSV